MELATFLTETDVAAPVSNLTTEHLLYFSNLDITQLFLVEETVVVPIMIILEDVLYRQLVRAIICYIRRRF